MGLSAPGIGSNLDINTMVSQLMALEGLYARLQTSAVRKAPAGVEPTV